PSPQCFLSLENYTGIRRQHHFAGAEHRADSSATSGRGATHKTCSRGETTFPGLWDATYSRLGSPIARTRRMKKPAPTMAASGAQRVMLKATGTARPAMNTATTCLRTRCGDTEKTFATAARKRAGAIWSSTWETAGRRASA